MFEKVPFFSMSIPALNDAISQKHYEKMRAIENLDFEKARLLDADKQQLVGERSLVQFEEIEKDTNNELMEIQNRYFQSMKDADVKYFEDLAEMKQIHNQSYAALQQAQLQETADLEARRERLMQQAEEDPDEECDQILAHAQEKAEMGDYQAVAKLKAMADETWTSVVHRRFDAISHAFDKDQADMLDRHRQEALELTTQAQTQKDALKQAAAARKQDIETTFLRSTDILKKKSAVRCQVLEVPPRQRDSFIRHLNLIVDDFVSMRNAAKQTAEQKEARSRMLATAAHKTRRLITSHHTTPKEQLRRTANSRAPTGIARPKPTFFTTQGSV